MNNSPRVDQAQVIAARQLSKIVKWVVYVIVGCVAVGATIDRPFARWFSLTGISLLTLVPFARVAWLVYWWRRQNDTKFASVGTGLILLAIVGTIFSLLSR